MRVTTEPVAGHPSGCCRILRRHGLVAAKKRKRGRADCILWQRDEPMELWQMDLVGGVMLADGAEAKVVTGLRVQPSLTA
jgi:hypothetical protein